MKGNIWQVGLVAVLLALLLPAANLAFVGATDVPRESHNVTIQEQPQSVPTNETAITFFDNETVTNASSGAEFSDDEYSWFAENGSISFNTSDPDVNEGDTANVTFSYRAGNEATRTTYLLFSNFGQVIGVLLMVVCAGVVLNMTFGKEGF